MALSGNTVLLGGKSFRGVSRNGLAAIDLATGRVLPWNPNPAFVDGTNVINSSLPMFALAATTRDIYVMGLFTEIGGKDRPLLAAVDPVTGIARDWRPLPNGVVTSIVPGDDSLYTGGKFSLIGGQPRTNIAVIDGVFLVGSTIYVAGGFTQIAGQNRAGLAGFDAATGLLKPWNPGLAGSVSDVIGSGATLMVSDGFGGGFTYAGGKLRNRLAVFPPVGWPEIFRQPKSQNRPAGQTVTFHVGAVGQEPLFYQWQCDGVNLPAATNTSLTIPNAQLSHSGDYSVVVTNSVGMFNSKKASLIRFPHLTCVKRHTPSLE